jgi:hypothetical protein
VSSDKKFHGGKKFKNGVLDDIPRAHDQIQPFSPKSRLGVSIAWSGKKKIDNPWIYIHQIDCLDEYSCTI